jgi:hypothetical protein
MNIRKIIKEEIDDFDWAKDVQVPDVTDADKYRVLVDILSYIDVFGDGDMDEGGFEENSWNHYGGITTFTLDNGQEWGVGTIDEFDNALREYWSSYADDHGVENIYNKEEYFRMSETDRRMFASDMADSYVDDMGDDDLIDTADLEDEMGEIQEKIEDLEILLNQTEDEDEMDVIRDEHQELESEKEELYDTAREAIRSVHYDDWYECLRDPYECLVNQHGLYDDADDLLNSNTIFFDDDLFVDDMMNSSDYSELAHYDGEYYEEGDYIAIRID